VFLSDAALLQCPECCHDLHLKPVRMDNDRVIDGTLSCSGCKRVYPILNEVCIFLSQIEINSLLSPVERESVSILIEGAQDSLSNISSGKQLKVGVNWNYQFANAFKVLIKDLENENSFHGKKAFFQFCGLQEQDVENQCAAVFCGGSGREAWHLVKANAKRVIVLDIGGHINSINHMIPDTEGKLLLIQCNVNSNPLRDGSMDVAICDHALQHISNHKQAYRKMSECLKPNGKFSVCVYSYENNWPMTHFIEPAKVVIHRLPVSFIRTGAALPALLLFSLSKTYDCLNIKLASQMPFFKLLTLWRGGGFRKFWEACFDLLHAPISHHFKKEEVTALADENAMSIITLRMVNDTMWTMVSKKN